MPNRDATAASTPKTTDQNATGPGWAARLLELCIALHGHDAPETRASVEEEAWLLLHAGLMRFARFHMRAYGLLSQEEVEDLASERALDLLQRATSGTWRLEGRHPREVAAFLSTVAHHAVIDHHRRTRRMVYLDRDSSPDGHVHMNGSSNGFEDPGVAVEHRETARALVDCIERLAPRARRIWFMRVMLDLPSRAIAEHPDVRLKAPHVDVILQRARDAIRGCFASKGFESEALPRSAFVDIWDSLTRLAESERDEP